MNVEGLPGIYLANSLGLSALEDAAFRWDAELTDYEKYVRSQVSLCLASSQVIKSSHHNLQQACHSCLIAFTKLLEALADSRCLTMEEPIGTY